MTALESDVRLTSDGAPVLCHNPTIGPFWRRRVIAETPRSGLPDGLLLLEGLYAELGAAFDLSLDLKVAEAFRPTVAAAEAHDAVERLWLCSGFDEVTRWRRQDPRPRLVHSTRLRFLDDSVGNHARRLADAGIDALNMRVQDWTAEAVAAAHEGGVLAFGWHAHRPATVARLLSFGCDAIYGDDVDLMLAGARAAGVGPGD